MCLGLTLGIVEQDLKIPRKSMKFTENNTICTNTLKITAKKYDFLTKTHKKKAGNGSMLVRFGRFIMENAQRDARNPNPGSKRVVPGPRIFKF